MADDAPEKKEAGNFDVVMLGEKTADGEGTRVLRARPGKLSAGVMMPLQDGKPLLAGEVVSLQKRTDVPQLYDVNVEHKVEAAEAKGTTQGPAQVATTQYRESWERIFGESGKALN